MVLVHAVREDPVAFASDLVVFMAAIGIESNGGNNGMTRSKGRKDGTRVAVGQLDSIPPAASCVPLAPLATTLDNGRSSQSTC